MAYKYLYDRDVELVDYVQKLHEEYYKICEVEVLLQKNGQQIKRMMKNGTLKGYLKYKNCYYVLKKNVDKLVGGR